jgi:hypothetical protein
MSRALPGEIGAPGSSIASLGMLPRSREAIVSFLSLIDGGER